MTTTLIKNGLVVDGTGAPPYRASVLIEDGLVKDVISEGEGLPPADNEVDASGKAVSPGFIDMHSHQDWILPLQNNPEYMKPLLEQGVTTIVGGNCGISPAPITPETKDRLEKFASTAMAEPIEYSWRSFGEMLDSVKETGPAVNMAELVGHASIRYAAAHTPRGPMTEEELGSCQDLLRKSFEQGACGLSFGLGYDPGMYSPLEELEALSRVAAEYDRPVTVHLKALSRMSPCYPPTYVKAHNVRALKDMLDVGRRAGARMQLSHFIFVGRNSWSTADTCIEMVEKARGEGMDVMIDAFPYTAGNTTVNAPFPYWFLADIPGNYDSRLARARLRLELELGFRLVGFIYKDFQVMDSAVPGWEDINGLTVEQVAGKWGTTPFDALLTLSRQSRGAATMLFHTYSGAPENEYPLELVLSRDYCLFETDTIIKSRGYPNPATLGTFPRILGEMARDRGLFSLEEAVSRMTWKSAQRFGLSGRGKISPGMAADIVIFDPEKINDKPPVGTGPAGKPTGIESVFVNGVEVVEKGEYNGEGRPGEVLTPN